MVPRALIVTLRNASSPGNAWQVCNLPRTTHFRRIGRLQTCPTVAKWRSTLILALTDRASKPNIPARFMGADKVSIVE